MGYNLFSASEYSVLHSDYSKAEAGQPGIQFSCPQPLAPN